MRLQKAQALEKRFFDGQAHQKSLMKEVEKLKKEKRLVERGQKNLRQELDSVKSKLD